MGTFGPLFKDLFLSHILYAVDKKAEDGVGDLGVLPMIHVCYILLIPDIHRNVVSMKNISFQSGTSGQNNLSQVSLFILLALSFRLVTNFSLVFSLVKFFPLFHH